MDGLLLVNKPSGITSFDVIRRLRKASGHRKIGHTGTLDPLASGLMILLVGTATKRSHEFMKLDKVYAAEITLGANSSTGDREGLLTSVSDREPTKSELESALKQLVGEITQTPPVYSAIKIGGREAYKLARAGQTVEMPKRRVTIYELQLVDYVYPIIKLTAKVSSGTYIRSLAEDIGRALGTGAYLSDLVRTEVGQFKLADAIDLPPDEQAGQVFYEALTSR